MTPHQAALKMRGAAAAAAKRYVTNGQIGFFNATADQIANDIERLPFPEESAPTGIEVTPDMLAAAWRAFQNGRQGVPFYIGSVGPGPGFKEAILAAFACASPTSPAPDVDVMGLLEAYEKTIKAATNVWAGTASYAQALECRASARAALFAAIVDLQQRDRIFCK